MNAIDTILDEHRSLAAVLHGLLYLVRAIDNKKMGADFKVMGAMVYYIDAFPKRFHRPKEDEYSGAIRSSAVRAIALTSRIAT
jgi:hemerythrin-like domain-containing protein